MHIFKRIISVICVLALFVGFGWFFRYVLIDDVSSHTRITLHNMYNTEQNIDALFVGSSHAYCSVIPSEADSILNMYTFVCGSSSQRLDGSLALIKEVAKNNNLKHVYLEMYYEIPSGEKYKDRVNPTETYIISDYMRPSLNKFKYLINATDSKLYSNSFIIPRRNWELFFDFDYIKDIVERKASQEYKNYLPPVTDTENAYYIERGFVGSTVSVDKNMLWNKNASGKFYALESVTDTCDWRMSLQDIIVFCNKNDIELILYSAPVPHWTILGRGDYDGYIAMIDSIASENNIDYFDFNLCKKEYLDTSDLSLFKDEDHLNNSGAKIFTNTFCQLITGHVLKEDIFHNSFAEKLLSEDPEVFGVAGPSRHKSGEYRYGRIISNRKEGVEYKVIVTPDGGQSAVFQDFNENNVFHFPVEGNGHITIHYRFLHNPEDIGVMELDY